MQELEHLFCCFEMHWTWALDELAEFHLGKRQCSSGSATSGESAVERRTPASMGVLTACWSHAP
eukprot:2740478-Rhodomonas_salina.1